MWVAIVFGMVDLVVVCGNIFVLYVIVSQKSMHTTTNFIVLSLTLSDFLLGLVILPFSIYQEYSSNWLLGDLWCEVWLALDVWLSTASIYNLLAISFDRYMAVRQPIKYRFISSTRMTRIMIALVWTISGLLAVPPLIYDMLFPQKLNSVMCTPTGGNHNYIIFSAVFSFVLPAILMIWLNVCILRTVSDSHRPQKTSFYGIPDKESVFLRVHRRGDDNIHNHSCRKQASRFTSAAASHQDSRSTGNSLTSLNSAPGGEMGALAAEQVHQHPLKTKQFLQLPTSQYPSPTSISSAGHIQIKESANSKNSLDPRSISPIRANSLIGEPAQKTVWYPAMIMAFIGAKKDTPQSERSLLHPMLNFNRASLRTELRVARTIAVVVGCFTICWLPFTIIYILQAYKTCPVPSCIPKWLFTLAFWLGYSNSAINPLLYSAFSRDFRSAFRRVLLPRSSFRSSQLR
uniref:G_PROTEIN_RECEP_F1_2 domain-containing protein n=1 Tax=Steinernema glaseri TaxID=37863 RepID=A0A1I8A5K1_9BILA